jgi:hypothetical protein
MFLSANCIRDANAPATSSSGAVRHDKFTQKWTWIHVREKLLSFFNLHWRDTIVFFSHWREVIIFAQRQTIFSGISAGETLLFFSERDCYRIENYQCARRGTPELATTANPLPRHTPHLGMVAMAKGGWQLNFSTLSPTHLLSRLSFFSSFPLFTLDLTTTLSLFFANICENSRII